MHFRYLWVVKHVAVLPVWEHSLSVAYCCAVSVSMNALC